MKTQRIVTITVLLFFASQLHAQQIPNGGFENWTDLRPDGWKTNSCPFCDPPYETYIVQQDSDASKGTYAAKFIYNNTYFAWIECTIATKVHPLSLFASVKCRIQTGDTVNISIHVYNNGSTVDSGRWQNVATIFDYQDIDIPISQNNISIDSVKINISGGNKINTVLSVDNVSFSLTSEIKVNLSENLVTLNPNPFKDFAWLKFKYVNSEKYVLTIYNVYGQVVKTFNTIYSGSVKIERGNLKSGLYFFKLNNYQSNIAFGKMVVQ